MKTPCTSVVALALLVFCGSLGSAGDPPSDHWAPIRGLVGSWQGEGDGTTVTHDYQFVIADKFIQSRTRSESTDEIHEDTGFFSYDPDREVLVFRQFLSEGFVNTYDLGQRETDGEPLVFTSSSCEGAGEMRARLTITFDGPDAYTMVLELAMPGKDWFACQNIEMKRVE